MKVVILCGGKGTRLREETEYRPKPMVPIGRYPILWHIMKYYACHGHTEFILCLGYKGEMIKSYFQNYHWNTCDVSLSLGRHPDVEFHGRHGEEDWKVTLVDTGEHSMTAYRVRQIQPFLGKEDTFLLTYGDGLTNLDIAACIDSHQQSGKICTVSAVHPTGRFGALHINSNGTIQRFQEKPQSDSDYVNGGYMVCDRKLFEYLPDDPSIMLETEPMSRLVADGQLNSFKHEGFWQPMDTYQETLYLNHLWETGRAPWKIW